MFNVYFSDYLGKGIVSVGAFTVLPADQSELELLYRTLIC